MAFIVALFLTYLDEENSFWMLVSFMKNYGFEESYATGFPGLRKDIYVFLVLLKKHIPSLFHYFKKMQITAMLYVYSWFLTCYSNVFRFDYVVRIFDCFLLEGKKVMFRIALGLLQSVEKKILKSKNLPEIVSAIQTNIKLIELDKLFKISFDFSISRDSLEKYEHYYERHKEDNNDEIIKMIGF